jgi:hypothetical protein
MDYEETKQKIISELLRSAAEQEAGNIWGIDGCFDDLEFSVKSDDTPEFDKLTIAMEFWAGWIDSRNHDWMFYKGIESSDWPKLARKIAEDLAADRYTDDQRIRDHFDSRYYVEPRSLWQRLKNYLTGGANTDES